MSASYRGLIRVRRTADSRAYGVLAGAVGAGLGGVPASSSPSYCGLLVRAGREGGLRLEAGEAVPGEVDQVSSDIGLLRAAYVEPPLTGQRDHADQHLGVHRGELRVQAA